MPGYSHTFTGEQVCDEQINEWLLELVEGEEHVYGYKLLAQCIRDQHNVRLDNAGEEMPVIRTDNGPQFVSKLFGDMCECLDVVHERIPPRTPNMNAYIESFHSLLERHMFSIRDFMTFDDAYEALDRYMDFYNNRRMHGSLKRKPPAIFSAWVKTLDDTSAFHKAM